jgi:hypothetical protein
VVYVVFEEWHLLGCHRVALVRTDVSEELSASFIKVTRIGELGTTLPVTSQKTPFFIVTTVKTSNLTDWAKMGMPLRMETESSLQNVTLSKNRTTDNIQKVYTCISSEGTF